jgi:hypothetical protein
MFISINMGNTSARPANDNVPRRPMYQDSVIPTAVEASMERILGVARRARVETMGRSSRD